MKAVLSGIAGAAFKVLPGSPATYRLFVSATTTPRTEQQSIVWHDVAVRYALLEPVSVRDLSVGGAGPVQIGDLVMTLLYADLIPHLPRAAAGGLSARDRVVAKGASHRVITWQTIGQEVLVRIFLRRES
jgi:hypothetical protein